MLDLKDLDGTARRWIAAAGILLGRYRGAAASLGRRYLTSLDLEITSGPVPVKVERFTASMHALGIAATKTAMGRGDAIELASAIGQSLTYGATSRYALDAQRDVIRLSTTTAGLGWRRVGDGGCDFCDMLIGRGSVYKEDTAQFLSHDRCRCTAEPDVEVFA